MNQQESKSRVPEISSADWRSSSGTPTSNWFQVDWNLTWRMKRVELARLELLRLDACPNAGRHDDREGTIAILHALAAYAKSQMPELELQAIRELILQLRDLDVGIGGPLLAKPEGRCRRKLSMSQYLVRIYSAAYLQALREANVPLAEAKAKVSATLGPACLRSGFHLTGSTVVNWRKQLRRAKGVQLDAEHFRDILTDWRVRGRIPTVENADNLATRLLERLTRIVS